jgi:hypoxanthine phosphoribosyltransferase
MFGLLIYLCIIHYVCINSLENLYFQTHVRSYSKLFERPTATCNDVDTVRCLSMPSRLVEVVTMACILIYLKGATPNYRALHIMHILLCIPIAIVVSYAFALNTVPQMLTGLFFGAVYAYMYFKLVDTKYVIAITILIILALATQNTASIERYLYEDIPSWVDPTLYPIINKKRTAYSFFMKVLTNLTTSVLWPNALFLPWKELETKLDHLINILTQQNLKYDAVVGLKSGGAILSNYVSKKLGLPCYYLKVSQKCNSKVTDSLMEIAQKVAYIKLDEFTVCEPIQANLEGLHILLLDEQIYSGTTMNAAIKYLTKVKKVQSLTPAALTDINKHVYFFHAIIENENNGNYSVYPWGYDN